MNNYKMIEILILFFRGLTQREYKNFKKIKVHCTCKVNVKSAPRIDNISSRKFSNKMKRMIFFLPGRLPCVYVQIE